MTRRADAPDILGTPNHGPLFDSAVDLPPMVPTQITVTVEASGPATVTYEYPTARSKGRATVNGGSALALDRITPALTGLRGRVYAGIVAYGPVTRETLADVLGMKKDTVNGRCAELLAAKLVRVTGHDRETGRGLLAVATPTETTE